MKQSSTIKHFMLKPVLLWWLVFMFSAFISHAQELRRPISPNQPMWLVHIDTWNYADPQKIIDLIPEDIRPYVVMNISLSISHNATTSQFQVAEYGYEIAKSWVRTCAQNRMWAMVQVSSGGYSQFSDFDLSQYEEFFQDYPNFIGFNYAEQFWGFDDPSDPLSASWQNRITHFANLLDLCHQYGGYLTVSWCGNQWSPSINPIAMLKRNAAFAQACSNYTENFILCEKYTQQSYQSDMESLCLGSYLSGFSGQYGIRYDDTGWTNINGEHEDFTMATGLAPHFEHMMLTGETVIDAPELIWTQCFYETNALQTTDGYTSRNWATFPQFDNVSVEIFRKILDGTVRIPTREEVIDRTKYVIINNVSTGGNDDKYSSPQTLFEGLYRMDGDGNYQDNKTFFKKTGRYPTIPTVYQLDDALANSFDFQINKTDYSTYWPTVTDKVTEFNSEFPEEYTGDLYAGRHENGWVLYNPYKTGQQANANIPFKYNTCSSMDVTFSQYSAGIVKETSDQLQIYLNNYDNELDTGLKIDVIKIYGSTNEPTFSYTERGNHQFSNITAVWEGGVYTLTIQHNGAMDLTVNCSGTATDRLTDYTPANLMEPTMPEVYAGPLQYEAEVFDRKNIASVTTSGYSGNIRNYTGQGYLEFGTNANAGVRDVVTVPNSGTYQLAIRYAVTGVSVNTIDLYVNGVYVDTPTFVPVNTLSDWDVNIQLVDLNAGSNTVELRANSAAAGSVYFDNMVVTHSGATHIWLEAECGTAGSLWNYVTDGTVSNNQYIQIQDGNTSTGTAPTDESAYVTYNFVTGDTGTYTVWGRVLAPDTDSNSLWLKMDDGNWFPWDDISVAADWAWNQSQTYSLSQGTHTLTVAYSEDGVGLDKIYITNTTDIPSGSGENVVSPCENVPDIGMMLTAAVSGQDVVLNWSLENVVWASQEVYRSMDADFGNSELLATLTGSDIMYTDNTAALDVTYYYWVKGTDGGNSLLSNPAMAMVSSDMWLEAECASVGSLWHSYADYGASHDYYVTVQAGNNSTDAAPTDPEGEVTFNFTVTGDGTYALWARVLCPGASDNSFWVKMDDGEWTSWEVTSTSTDWAWNQQSAYALTAGDHVLKIAYQEDGAKLDKIYLTRLGTTPAGTGEAAVDCAVVPDSALVLSAALVNNEIVLTWIMENSAFVSQEVYRSLDDNINNATVIATLDGVAVSYTDLTAEPGVIYYYWVKGISGNGSMLSNMVQAATEETNTDIWIEAECAIVGGLWNINPDTGASNGNYVTIQSGNNSSAGATSDPNGHIVFDLNITSAGVYTLWARAQSPSANDDSFWLKMDDGNWDLWNGVTNSASWSWGQFLSYDLTAGTHTLTIAYREDGATLDKIYLTKTTLVPTDFGGIAEACNPPHITLTTTNISNNIVLNWTVDNATFISQKVYRGVDTNFNNSTELATLDNATFTYMDDTAVMGTTYYYWVQGIYEDTATLLSNITNAALQNTAADIWLESECGTVGSLWNVNEDINASHGYYVTIQPGNTNTGEPSADPSGQISYTFDVTEGGSYMLWGRLQVPNASDDSFFLKIDSGGWATWNNIPTAIDWGWRSFQTYTLSAGTHTLLIAYREDGANLDKIYFTKTSITPSGVDDEAGNCDGLGVYDIDPGMVNGMIIYPNPVHVTKIINIISTLENASVVNARIVNTMGQEVYSTNLGFRQQGELNCTIEIPPLQDGMYILQLQSDNGIKSQKFIIE